jgi:hypothetical protein
VNKLVIYVLLMVFGMLLMAVQIDEELAMNTVFQVKHGVNRAVHAAAQQMDQDKLAQGIAAIDEERAEAVAYQYLQANLDLDEDQTPLPGSFLRTPVEILVFEVINNEEIFPYHYVNAQFGYEVTLDKPGAVLIIGVEYPRIYAIIQPIHWVIKGTAELYEVRS